MSTQLDLAVAERLGAVFTMDTDLCVHIETVAGGNLCGNKEATVAQYELEYSLNDPDITYCATCEQRYGELYDAKVVEVQRNLWELNLDPKGLVDTRTNMPKRAPDVEQLTLLNVQGDAQYGYKGTNKKH